MYVLNTGTLVCLPVAALRAVGLLSATYLSALGVQRAPGAQWRYARKDLAWDYPGVAAPGECML